MIPNTCRRTAAGKAVKASCSSKSQIARNSTATTAPSFGQAQQERLAVPSLLKYKGNRTPQPSGELLTDTLRDYVAKREGLTPGEDDPPYIRIPSRHVGHHSKGPKPKESYLNLLRIATGAPPLERGSFPPTSHPQAPQADATRSLSNNTGLVTESWVTEKWIDALSPEQPRKTGYLGRNPRKKVKKNPKDPPPHGIPLKEVEGILASEGEEVLEDVEPTTPGSPVAQLAHGLDRVLFNPGVHWVQDPRSRVYNFPPSLEVVPKVSDFDYDRLPGFVPSSRDNDLRALAEREGKRFAGSTSSLSGILSQCYFLISETKEVDTSRLSTAFRNEPKTFTPGQRWPASVILNHKDGVYTIDSDKSKTDAPDKTILTWLGTLLEKYLTTPPEQFKKYLKSHPPSPDLEELKQVREAYRYSKSDDFVMRSQLDCFDPRLPGTGVFDIKTRACVATRMDILNYEEHRGYTIRQQHGIVESFEKEYYDLIRSAFLKYSFQVRIGNMDGVIVAYHNTGRIFGFQYIPLSDMDACLYGSTQEGVGDRVFEKCVGLMEKVMHEVAECFPGESVKATLETKEDTKGMHVWVEPLEWEGLDEERPIEQIRVEATSYSGTDPVKGLQAAVAVDNEWTLRYKISRLDIVPETKRKNLEMARARQNAAYLIPSNVAEDELEEFWNSISHGAKPEHMTSTTEFDPSMFIPPPPRIQVLRKLSRKGKEDMEALEDEPKVVWEGHAGSA